MSGVVDEFVEGLELSPELVSVMTGSKPAVVLGLDVGTSGVRAALFDQRGSEVSGGCVRTHHSFSTFNDYATLDADAIVELVADTIDLLLAQPFISTEKIELIAISCFWHSLVGVDANNTATTPVLTWADTRAAEAARDLRRRLDETETHNRTGCRIHPCYWPAKLAWLRDEHPDVFRSTNRWLSFSEYLTSKLFAETQTSVSMASGTGLLDLRSCDWDKELLNELRLPVSCLSEIATNSVSRSRLTGDFAIRWPQLSGALLCPTIADGAANNIGAGCTTREKLALMIGTSAATRIFYEGDPPASIPAELWCYRADCTRVVIGGALSDGGGLYRWFRDLLLPNESFEAIEELLQTMSPDSHGLTVLPFWNGERSTGWSLQASGAVHGFKPDTTPIDILRATMEAIAYRFALIVKALEPFSDLQTIIATGNALRSSRVWSQIIADVIGRPISVSDAPEASTRGAALLALEAAGKIPTIDEVRYEVYETFTPDAARHARYQAGLERQQKLYNEVMK
jgi:gluconokinase